VTLKGEIEEMVNENKNETKRMMDVLRKELMNNYNKLDLKFSQTNGRINFGVILCRYTDFNRTSG